MMAFVVSEEEAFSVHLRDMTFQQKLNVDFDNIELYPKGSSGL